MWLKQVETRLWLYQCLSDESKNIEGVFQADGASPLEALLLQHHQFNEYRQPQFILSLKKRISSMEMTHLITSPCHDIHALLFSASYLLGTFFITTGCPVYIVLYKWFDVMTCLGSTCYLFVNNLSIKLNITPHRLIL